MKTVARSRKSTKKPAVRGRRSPRNRASKPRYPIAEAMAGNAPVIRWEPKHRSLVPLKFTEDRHSPDAIDQSVGDLILLGLGHNSQADIASGALAAIAVRLSVLGRAFSDMESRGVPIPHELTSELWSIGCHARAASHLHHRMLGEEAPKGMVQP